MKILNWIYVEIMATFKPEPYIHVCQNYRVMYGFPLRWHRNYIKIRGEKNENDNN